ncbi:activator protein [Burkholderia stabilis]|uniref:Activator protein n=1 Tax=Burkholderia stabilis TaxID=95485 RepID=A0AAJ5NAX1_9BURK|nr:activator protein [Burkholderia stabilis]VBB14915.1 hypothetical protein BSTAB16_5106 [Burkholderia stabilis]
MKIRQIVSLVAAALTAVSAAPAFAVSISRADGQPMNPNGEPFSAAGLLLVKKAPVLANCTATFNGTITSAGIVNITSAQFTGGSICAFLSNDASSTAPWTGQADSTTQWSINNMKVNVALVGTCGPDKVVATWGDANSSMTFNNSVLTPDCGLDGRIITSPRFHVQ